MSSAASIPIPKKFEQGLNPNVILSETPGGTIYGVTPGGTKIIYDRNKLMQLRNSPLAKTPPANLPNIAGITKPVPQQLPKELQPQPQQPKKKEDKKKPHDDHDDIFHME